MSVSVSVSMSVSVSVSVCSIVLSTAFVLDGDGRESGVVPVSQDVSHQTVFHSKVCVRALQVACMHP